MAYPEYKRDLLSDEFDANYVLDKYYHSGQSAVFFGSAPDEEPKLLQTVATAIFSKFSVRIHPLQLIICGSAHLGFSPVPDKLGKSFDSRTSDIDLAVISPEIFDNWWSELQSVSIDQNIRFALSRDLFWGFINPAIARDCSTLGQKWWDTFGAIRTDRAAGVRGRLYRTFWSMQSYHRLAIYGGHKRLVEERDRRPSQALDSTPPAAQEPQ